MWRVIQTRPFQRLRRVKQLGFSEFVYPGATHSRFAHSIGVFHTARMLMQIIQQHLEERHDWSPNKAFRAKAGALVHDVGHGPFSHSFEDVGRRLGLKLADHELVSDALIRDSEIAVELNKLGTGFAADVADIVRGDGAVTTYSTVVSSQFDADRLDYMRRDRLMTGTHHGAIDFEWLIKNIEIGEVSFGVDDQVVGTTNTFVLGPKAIYAAESYVLGLFQLYPTVYFHKTTRGAEKIFTELMCRVIELILDNKLASTGLPKNHPICRFAKHSDDIENVLALDDTVVTGSLGLLADASDGSVSELARRLRDRKFLRVIDIRERLRHELPQATSGESRQVLDKKCASIAQKIEEWSSTKTDTTRRILSDSAKRHPYKALEESKGPLNQIRIRTSSGKLVDLGEQSKVVAAIEPFQLFRVYLSREDSEASELVEKLVKEEVANGQQ